MAKFCVVSAFQIAELSCCLSVLQRSKNKDAIGSVLTSMKQNIRFGKMLEYSIECLDKSAFRFGSAC